MLTCASSYFVSWTSLQLGNRNSHLNFNALSHLKFKSSELGRVSAWVSVCVCVFFYMQAQVIVHSYSSYHNAFKPIWRPVASGTFVICCWLFYLFYFFLCRYIWNWRTCTRLVVSNSEARATRFVVCLRKISGKDYTQPALGTLPRPCRGVPGSTGYSVTSLYLTTHRKPNCGPRWSWEVMWPRFPSTRGGASSWSTVTMAWPVLSSTLWPIRLSLQVTDSIRLSLFIFLDYHVLSLKFFPSYPDMNY